MTCDDLYDETIAFCNRQPSPYDAQCRHQTEFSRMTGNWVFPDCWGEIKPRVPLPHEYKITANPDIVLYLVASDLPYDYTYTFGRKEQTERVQAPLPTVELCVYRAEWDRRYIELIDRCGGLIDGAQNVWWQNQLPISGDDTWAPARIEFDGFTNASITVDDAYEPNLYWGVGERVRSFMDMKYTIRLPEFKLDGTQYVVTHNIRGVNREDKDARDEDTIKITVRTPFDLAPMTIYLQTEEGGKVWPITSTWALWTEVDGVLRPYWDFFYFPDDVPPYALDYIVAYQDGCIRRGLEGGFCPDQTKDKLYLRSTYALDMSTYVFGWGAAGVSYSWNDAGDCIEFDTGFQTYITRSPFEPICEYVRSTTVRWFTGAYA